MNQLETAVAKSAARRHQLTSRAQSRTQELSTLRTTIRELTDKIEKLTTDVHRDEIARAEQRLRVEQLETKSLEEYGVSSEELIAEYGPEVLVPPSAIAAGDEVDPEAPAPQPYPFVRAEQEKRLRQAEKQMALLGRVNPLALEEFTAMEERHTFLNTQLEDLKRSRKDLLEIVLMPETPSGDFAWLGFTGRWGQKAPSFNNGPTGPNTKTQWSEPVQCQRLA